MHYNVGLGEKDRLPHGSASAHEDPLGVFGRRDKRATRRSKKSPVSDQQGHRERIFLNWGDGNRNT